MLTIKRVAAIILLALMMSFGAPQALAGEISTPGFADGPTETPGINGPMDTPQANGEMGCPGVNGEMPGAGFADGPTETPGFDGWIGTGLYAALAALFG